MRILRIYGKGFGAVGGTSPIVTRLSIFTAAMSVCDPSLEGHASRVGAARRGGRPPARLDGRRARGAAARRRAARRRQGERPSRTFSSKPGRLDDAELAEVRAHPVEGAWLIAGIPSLAAALPYVLFHHERWDGCGYPTRRAGLEIPLEGRLLAVADAFDAMTSSRPYCDAARVRRGGCGGRAVLGLAVRSDDRGRIRGRVCGGRDRRRRAAFRRCLSRLRRARGICVARVRAML